MRPLIGITCSRLVGGEWGLYSPGHFMDYTFDDYSRGILHCGGAPVLIPIAQNPDSVDVILNHLHGLILSGGPDIHPRFYGEQPRTNLGDLDEGLDLAELHIAWKAIERDLPIFGICRGMQLLNVTLGGKLYQDINTELKNAINHQQKADKGTNTHQVKIVRDSLLYRHLQEDNIWVNGKHHQAIKEVAQPFTVVAHAPDGLIEAIEIREKKFVLGVQWHPEGTWQTDSHSEKLFAAFVDACR